MVREFSKSDPYMEITSLKDHARSIQDRHWLSLNDAESEG